MRYEKQFKEKIKELKRQMPNIARTEFQPKLSNIALYKHFLVNFSTALKNFYPKISIDFRPSFSEFELFFNTVDDTSDLDYFNEYLDLTRKILKPYYSHSFGYELITYWAFWEILVSENLYKKDIKHVDNPYNYIIMMRKRNGDFHASQGFYYIDTYEIRNDDKYATYTLPSIDISFLDYIDKRCGINRKNIPTQSDLNKLFYDFNNPGEETYTLRHDSLEY